MNPPAEKVIPKLSGDLERYVIPNYIIKMYDGKLIDDGIDKCERCGSRHLQKHGARRKLFCTVVLESGFKNVCIWRQCYRCMECHHVNVSGKDLFYDGCEYSRVIVDQCLALAAHNPANRAERLMLESGLQVDQRTVLRYIKQFKLRIVDRNPLKLGDANIGVNLVNALFGKETIAELQRQYPEEKYAAEADEVYPRMKGALEKHSSLKVLAEALNNNAAATVPKKPDDNAAADAQPKKEEKKEAVVNPPAAGATPKTKEENIVKYNKFPDSFTLALAYINTLKFYASIICSKMSFNSLLASVLFEPLRGVVCALTDGSPIYNRLADDRCLFHYMMNFFKRDPGLENLRRGKPPPVSSILASEYMREMCELVRAEYISHLMAKHPELVVKDDEGELKYVGPTTTSAVEGGNHRLKYELRVPYKDTDTLCGRAILAAVKDSMYTFRNGRPEVSFAHIHSSFTFSSVMAATADATTSQPVHFSSNFTTQNNFPHSTTSGQPIQL